MNITWLNSQFFKAFETGHDFHDWLHRRGSWGTKDLRLTTVTQLGRERSRSELEPLILHVTCSFTQRARVLRRESLIKFSHYLCSTSWPQIACLDPFKICAFQCNTGGTQILLLRVESFQTCSRSIPITSLTLNRGGSVKAVSES